MTLDVQRLTWELENITDCGSSEHSDKDCEAVPDLDTVRSTVGKVVWVYHPSHSVPEAGLVVSPKSKPSTSAPNPVPPLRSPLRGPQEDSHSARSVDEVEITRARDTIWEGRLRNLNRTQVSKPSLSTRVRPSGVKKRQHNMATGSSVRLGRRHGGQKPESTATASQKTDRLCSIGDPEVNHRRGRNSVCRKTTRRKAVRGEKTLQMANHKGLVKGK